MDVATTLLSQLDYERFMSIDRQFIRADRMRYYYYSFVDSKATIEDLKSNPKGFYVKDIGIFMFLWYALLFSVLEGFFESKIDISFLDNEYNSLYKILKNNRHSVFHTSDTYWDKRNADLIDLPNIVERINHVHLELLKLLDESIKLRKQDNNKQDN